MSPKSSTRSRSALLVSLLALASGCSPATTPPIPATNGPATDSATTPVTTAAGPGLSDYLRGLIGGNRPLATPAPTPTTSVRGRLSDSLSDWLDDYRNTLPSPRPWPTFTPVPLPSVTGGVGIPFPRPSVNPTPFDDDRLDDLLRFFQTGPFEDRYRNRFRNRFRPVDFPVGGFGLGNAQLVIQARTFSTSRYDLYNLDVGSNSITSVPGVTGFGGGNKTNPSLSANGRYLAWQTDEAGDSDIYVTDLNAVGNVYPGSPNGGSDEQMPAVDNSGRVYYVQSTATKDSLKRFSPNGSSITYSAVTFRKLSFPAVNADGSVVAFGGGNTLASQRVYYITPNAAQAQVFNPAGSNTGTRSYNPAVNNAGTRLLFVSDALGGESIFELDLASNTIDTLAQLNNISGSNKQAPRYLGGGTNLIAFQVVNGSLGRVAVYNRSSGTIAILSSQFSLFNSSLLRTP